MELDDDAWRYYQAMEETDDVTEAMQYLHPFHHRMVRMYELNLLKLPGAQRAQVREQHAAARERMYRTFAAAELAPSLVANDIEGAAVALLSANDVQGAMEGFRDAGARFAAFYGASGADAERCERAATATNLAEYAALSIEVLAHH